MNRKNASDLAHREAGFVLVRHGRHQVWRCPCGHALVVTSGSRPMGSGDINALSRMRRTLRECAERQEKVA